MKIFRKERLSNGRRHIYFCGVKIASYKKAPAQSLEPKHNIVGENNAVDVPQDSWVRVTIYGDNNTVVVGPHKYHDDFRINIGTPDCHCDNCTVVIGNDFSCNGASMLLLEDNTTVKFGNDCMLSDLISIWPSDTHTMTDLDGKITNIGKSIKIGNHVWIGQGATILKNTTIASNCIVGTRSVVGGKYTKSNCVIAGNPAKIVKENVNWDRRRPKQYMSGQ